MGRGHIGKLALIAGASAMGAIAWAAPPKAAKVDTHGVSPAALAVHMKLLTLDTHIDAHGHPNKRGVSLEPIYCLGLCASGPNALIDGRPHARLTPDRFDALAKELA